ncbi:Uncharacterised protein [Enterobacter hormaechei]|nr:Uncharacterised protein [Enterobacter hormaechei]
MLVFILTQSEIDIGFGQCLNIGGYFRAGSLDFGHSFLHLFNSSNAIVNRRLHRLNLFGVRHIAFYSGLTFFGNQCRSIIECCMSCFDRASYGFALLGYSFL